MKEWFQSLSGLEIAYFVIACVGTLFLLVQIILMIIGAADGDADFDTDTDGDGALDSHTDTGISLFTMKGLTAFFAIGGWTGLSLPKIVAPQKAAEEEKGGEQKSTKEQK